MHVRFLLCLLPCIWLKAGRRARARFRAMLCTRRVPSEALERAIPRECRRVRTRRSGRASAFAARVSLPRGRRERSPPRVQFQSSCRSERADRGARTDARACRGLRRREETWEGSGRLIKERLTNMQQRICRWRIYSGRISGTAVVRSRQRRASGPQMGAVLGNLEACSGIPLAPLPTDSRARVGPPSGATYVVYTDW